MTDKLYKPIILSQIEDALEEREGSDRRKNPLPVPPSNLVEDRRKGDRRASRHK